MWPLKLFLFALTSSVMVNCSTTRVQVRDQGTGVAVVYAQAVILRGHDEQLVDQADAEGNLAFRIPNEASSIVAIRAQGFLQWSKPIAWFENQAQPIVIELEPLWMKKFLQTGFKPSQMVEPKGCDCHRQR